MPNPAEARAPVEATLVHLDQERHDRVADTELGGVDAHVRKSEEVGAVEIALAGHQVTESVGAAQVRGGERSDECGIQRCRPDDLDAADDRGGPGRHPQREVGRALGRVHGIAIEIDRGRRVAAVAQALSDRVGGGSQRNPGMWVAHSERQVLGQRAAARDFVESGDLERADPDRLSLVDPEGDVHVFISAPHQGVDLGFEVSVDAVEHSQPKYVRKELLLIQTTLLAQPQRAQDRKGGKPTRRRRGDRSGQEEIIQRAIPFEAQLANDQFFLRLGGRGMTATPQQRDQPAD